MRRILAWHTPDCVWLLSVARVELFLLSHLLRPDPDVQRDARGVAGSNARISWSWTVGGPGREASRGSFARANSATAGKYRVLGRLCVTIGRAECSTIARHARRGFSRCGNPEAKGDADARWYRGTSCWR